MALKVNPTSAAPRTSPAQAGAMLFQSTQLTQIRLQGRLRPLAAQLVQITSLALGQDVQLCARHRQHGQQLARAEFAPRPRSKRQIDLGVTPAWAATSPCLSPSSLRRAATA